MATITFTIGSLTKSWTITSGDLNRLVESLKGQYGAGLTNQQLFDALTAEMSQGWKDRVTKYEKKLAEDAAANYVSTITLT